jgi:hypothetical protein
MKPLRTAIREDRDPAMPIEEGVLSLKLTLAAAQAAKQDALISLEPPVEVRSSQEIE